MRIFKEEQAFRQWWLILILGMALIVTSIPLIRKVQDLQSLNLEILGFLSALVIGVLFWNLKLKTRIDSSGVHSEFAPFPFFEKHYNWNEISKCYVRQYSPVLEYGGWGIRGLGKAKAYNVSGNMGIQIITNDQKKFLIGTNKPEEARRTIRHYQKKFDKR